MSPARFTNLVTSLFLAVLTASLVNFVCCTWDPPPPSDYPSNPDKCPGQVVCSPTGCLCEGWVLMGDGGAND